ncbi:ATP-binding protein [Streptomyces sp. 796.1]|uniref:ATP-binding protein n=1 Tax=Streptomyces sp. 796.1 TaxID=3163029 RepID=UPI0039C9EC3C
MTSAKDSPVRPRRGFRRAVPRTAGEARQWVTELVRRCHPVPSDAGRESDALADPLLVTSELVTNAIRHGGGVTGFWIALDAGVLRLGVRDHSDAVPRVRPRESAAAVPVGGYGWPLVCRLASEVDILPCPGGGKEIRVALPLPWQPLT